jgi:hypothetical protein
MEKLLKRRGVVICKKLYNKKIKRVIRKMIRGDKSGNINK